MVSRIALGGIPLMRVSQEEAVAVVREALALGVNFIDTANAYASSEAKIGKAIRGVPREELVLATKSLANSAPVLSQHLDNSLRMLGVDYVDIFQLHNVSSQEGIDAVCAEQGSLTWLDEQVKAGKVRFPAFSSHSVTIALSLMQTNAFDAVQLPLNFIDREAVQAVSLARTLDMGFIAMKPLGGGLLENPSLAFRYLLQFEDIVPDPGIEKLAEIREIAALVETNEGLSAADEAEIARLREELGATWCHRCDYCQPCPEGIPISSVLVVKSTFKRFNAERAHALADKAIARARNCTECGTCLPRCPYHLAIPQLLKENLAYVDAAQWKSEI
jgi:predicted aldo/keto reductase-like oxidoreductase